MNKVDSRCIKEGCAKFYYASKRLFFEVKTVKIILYLLAIIPIVLSFIPLGDNINQATFSFACSMVSFSLTIINECATSFINNHKEKAILEHQIYEAEITGSTFSKIEYDREATNEVHELAIRKGLPKVYRVKEIHKVSVPQQINDDYSYLYLCRRSAATNRYLLSRIFYIYFFVLMLIAGAFVGAMFYKTETFEYLTLLIGFYPLIIPFIRNCAACKKTMKICAKICADIDNFFSDGDCSIERLARFYYYVQNIEFEMLLARPAMYNIFSRLFRRGTNVLTQGVTTRFIEAIDELKSRNLMLKGLVSQPKGKGLITRVDLDIEKLEQKAKCKTTKTPVVKQEEPLKVEEKPTVVQAKKEETKPKTAVRKTVSKKQEDVKPQPVEKTTKPKVYNTSKKSS